jgi:hypothetical protein
MPTHWTADVGPYDIYAKLATTLAEMDPYAFVVAGPGADPSHEFDSLQEAIAHAEALMERST